MTQQEIVQNLLNEVDFRIRNSGITNVTFNLIKETLQQTLEDLQYVMIPKEVDSAVGIDDFQRIVAQNIATGQDVEFNEVYGEQIIRQLSHEGWLVIPPQK